MRKSPLQKYGSYSSAQTKRGIQILLRTLKLLEQKDCWVKLMYLDPEMGECDHVMQYDHLETRAKSISYGDPRLGVLVCRRHHFWHGSPRREQRERYEELVREFIGPERCKLWDKVRKDTRAHPFSAYDWQKVALSLKTEIKKLL